MLWRVVKSLYRRFIPAKKMSLPFYTAEDPRYAQYHIGEGTYGTPRVLSWDKSTSLFIGKYCSFAEGVTILLGGEHRIDWVTTYPFNVLFPEARAFTGHPTTKGNVVIGNDVWIGTDALILSGVHVADGAVVAARSVVTRDVAPFSIVGGNPARHIKFRFPDETINHLLAIAWWDWPRETIVGALPLLLSGNIDAFVNHYRNAKNNIDTARAS